MSIYFAKVLVRSSLAVNVVTVESAAVACRSMAVSCSAVAVVVAVARTLAKHASMVGVTAEPKA